MPNKWNEHHGITTVESSRMRAFRTFSILVFGLVTGGYLGFWSAKLLTTDNAQLLALEQQIHRLHEQVETGELMLTGSADILARQIQRAEQLAAENQSLNRALERAQVANEALKTRLADAGIPTSANAQ